MAKPGARIILAARFVFFCMEIGLAKSFGVLVPELEEQLQTSNAIVGLITSLSLAMMYLGSPIAKMLLHRCSNNPRILTSFCGLAAGCSLITVSFTRNLALMGALLISLGLCSSVVNLQALVLLHEYYQEDFAFVSCISVLGIPFGAAILPLLTEKLLEQYGLSGTLLIVGGLVLNMLPIGIVLKPPRTSRPPSDVMKTQGDFEPLEMTLSKATEENSKVSVQISTSENTRLKADVDVESRFHDRNLSLSNQKSGHKQIRNHTYVAIQSEPEYLSQTFQETFCDEVAEERQHNAKDTINIASIKRESEVPLQDLSTRTEDSHENRSTVASCLSYFYLDVIIKEPLFSIFYLPAIVLLFLVTGGWALFVVLYAVEHGIGIARGTYLATSGAIGGILASILISVGLHYRPKWSPQFWIVSNVLYAVMFFLQILSSSYGYLLFSSFLIGFGLFAVNVDLEAVMSLIVEKDNFPDAGNLFLLAIGIGYIASGYISGFVQDRTGNIKVLFVFLGVISTIGLVLFSTMVIIFRRKFVARNRDSNAGEH